MKTKTNNQEMVKSSVEDNDSFAHWQLPDVSRDAPASPNNLFGKRAGASGVTPEASENILPPTMAQIEDIREQAEAEGLEQGRQAGYAEGLEKGRLEGLEQGHLQGLEQGHQQGFEQGVAEAKEQALRVATVMEQFQLPLSILDNQIEQELLALVTSLSRAVICNELKTHPEHIFAALRQGIDSLPIKEQQVKLRLHPQDAQLMEELYSAEQLQRNRWLIELDPLLKVGDCIIDSQRSQVDMRLDARMQSVLEHMTLQGDHLQNQERQLQAELAAKSPVHAAEQSIPSITDSTEPQMATPDAASEPLQPQDDRGKPHADSTTSSAE